MLSIWKKMLKILMLDAEILFFNNNNNLTLSDLRNTCLASESIVGNREDAGNQHFPLFHNILYPASIIPFFHNVFYPAQNKFKLFSHIYLVVFLQMLSISTTIKFCRLVELTHSEANPRWKARGQAS